MNGHGEKLTRKQEQAIASLLIESTFTAAATRCGVRRKHASALATEPRVQHSLSIGPALYGRRRRRRPPAGRGGGRFEVKPVLGPKDIFENDACGPHFGARVSGIEVAAEACESGSSGWRRCPKSAMRTIGHSRLVHRLDKVEARLNPGIPRPLGPALRERLLGVMGSGDPAAVRRAVEDLPTWQALFPTMDPEHVAIVLDVFASGNWPRERTGRCNLARIVYHILAQEWGGPLALPRVVADLYLNDPDTLPIHNCAACRYRIPTYAGSGCEKREVYFAECPLCGGRIRWELIRMSDSPIGPDGYPLHPKL